MSSPDRSPAASSKCEHCQRGKVVLAAGVLRCDLCGKSPAGSDVPAYTGETPLREGFTDKDTNTRYWAIPMGVCHEGLRIGLAPVVCRMFSSGGAYEHP